MYPQFVLSGVNPQLLQSWRLLHTVCPLDTNSDACDLILENTCIIPCAVLSDKELALPPRAGLSRLVSATNRTFLALSNHEWELKLGIDYRYYGNYSCKMDKAWSTPGAFMYNCDYKLEKCDSDQHFIQGVDYKCHIKEEFSKDNISTCARPYCRFYGVGWVGWLAES